MKFSFGNARFWEVFLLWGVFASAVISNAIYNLFFFLCFFYAAQCLVKKQGYRPFSNLREGKFLLPFLLLWVGIFSSTFFAWWKGSFLHDPSAPFEILRAKIQYPFWFLWFFLFFLKKDIALGIKILFLFLFLQAGLGISQYYGWWGEDLQLFLFGENAWILHPIPKTNAVRYEAVGTTGFHLYFAQQMVLGFFPFLCVGTDFLGKGKKKFLFWGVGVFIFLLALLFSFARSFWLALLFTVPVFLFFFFKNYFPAKKENFFLFFAKGRGILFLLFFFGIFASGFFWIKNKSELLENPLLKRFVSSFSFVENQDRYWMWKAGLSTLKQSPIFGFGKGNVEVLKEEYNQISLQTGHIFYNKAEVGVHNFYLQTWLEFGIFGLVGMVWLLVFPLWRSFSFFLLPRKGEKDKIPAPTHFSSHSFWGLPFSMRLEIGLSLSIFACLLVNFLDMLIFAGVSKNIFWIFLSLLYFLQWDRKKTENHQLQSHLSDS